MSRRLRQEAEKLKQLNDEVQEEEDKIKKQKERISAPLIWKRLSSGIRIQDLKTKYFDDVLKIVEEHYMVEEVLCRNTNIKEDPKSVKSFLNKVLFNLKDSTSIIALDEITDDAIAGFLILKVVRKAEFTRVFSRVQLIDGDAHKTCVNFTSNLNRKADVFTDLNCDVFLRYYLLCNLPEYRKKGLGYHLMLAAVDVARSLNIPVVMGLFSCYSLQKLAKKIGMKVVHEINYVDWRDRFDELIFDEPGVGNYSCAVMAGSLPPVAVIDSNLAKRQEPAIEVVKMTREDKRKLKAKKAAKK